LVDLVVAQYLGSGDFNGLPADALVRTNQVSLEQLKLLVAPLINEGILSANFGSVHPNPHIRALPDLPMQKQLEALESADDHFVLYPTASTLANRVDQSAYAGRPFSLRLALGAPQLDFVSFDVAVIDHYRRDPRYRFWTNDIQATLSIGDDAFESEDFPEKHKVLIQCFGFSYSAELSRAVAVFLTDLDRLTPEHQRLWEAFELEGDYKLHPDYFRAAVLGDWELKTSLREAFVEELRTINAMCEAIGWPPLFRSDYNETPRELALLIRPTVAEFNEFVHVLDKLMSENINSDFFPARIRRETESQRGDGKIVVQQRGSIALLEDWLKTSFRTPDAGPLNELIATFRKIRRLRQKPAHSVNQDAYDESLFGTQRELFSEAYDAVRTIRLMLQNHPRGRAVADEMNQQVRVGAVWTY
jgi:hypothetical protein